MIILDSNMSEQKYAQYISFSEEKLLSFLKLPKGWYFGGGKPPSQETVDQALSILYEAQLYRLKTDAIPGADGEVQILCFNENDTLEFTIEQVDRITYVFEQGEQEVSYLENLSLEIARKKLKDYGVRICNISDSFTQATTSGTNEDLAVRHSKIPPMEAEYRLFLSPAQMTQQGIFVNTLGHFIRL